MTYITFRDLIREKLMNTPAGLTWAELRDSLKLPYDRPCAEWTRRLEMEIKLIRCRNGGRAHTWSLSVNRRVNKSCVL